MESRSRVAFVTGIPATVELSGVANFQPVIASRQVVASRSLSASKSTFVPSGASIFVSNPVPEPRTFVFCPSAIAAPPAPKQDEFELLREGVKRPASESILTPRFYTTDFDEMAKMDVSANLEELEALNQEFRNDYNRDHFVRNDDFNQSFDHIDGETRRYFVEFLERSCTAEFSGFLLYKELARRLKDKNPVLAESFLLMSRDEARHAGFLNKALSDFKLQLDLGFLTKSRNYTYFKPKYIFFATYLSEKIGYWRYITIFQHLRDNPEHRIYPIFKFFDAWCQDENRHGDFFDAVMRSQPAMVNDWSSKLWSRFFLLSVFATMYLNDVQRAKFYASIGLDAREYDKLVITKTNETAAKIFPCILDVNHPDFYKYLDNCTDNTTKLEEIGASNQPKVVENLRKLPVLASTAINLLRCFFIPPIETATVQGHAK